ncbi:uncharacterized protein DNG_04664 [Cephalotrichum gorgonifer]|uniref:Infection structure specific protein n=1 Tax=Cephalotrichum gorgonifer TaxID=2041049 RepID=A0AAE8MWI1_9PEZI|nr:uncharacterized protein DNG_04664 [Cephalotrichum gorgonifer]
MDKFVAISTLVVAVTATLPNPVVPLNRRQVEVPPEVASSIPSDCLDSLQEIYDTIPAAPTPIAEFSSSFYETASRTATATGEECAWITNMPEDVTDTYLKWTDDFINWSNDANNQKEMLEFQAECGDAAEAVVGSETGVCVEEWQMFKDKAEADGWKPPKIEVGGESASPGGLEVRVYTVATVAASVIGVMALL